MRSGPAPGTGGRTGIVAAVRPVRGRAELPGRRIAVPARRGAHEGHTTSTPMTAAIVAAASTANSTAGARSRQAMKYPGRLPDRSGRRRSGFLTAVRVDS